LVENFDPNGRSIFENYLPKRFSSKKYRYFLYTKNRMGRPMPRNWQLKMPFFLKKVGLFKAQGRIGPIGLF